MKESGDVSRAEENVEAYQQQLDDLSTQLESEIAETSAKMDTTNETLEKIPLRPKKTDIKVRMVALAWVPYWQSADGDTPAWS
jgi:prefoldin subunit 5